jgi:hypothetical protein
MNSLVDATLDQATPDYYARALALWPRLELPRPGRVRRDPHRIASLISRRTNLSYQSILELLGAPGDEAGIPARDH